MKFFLKNNKQEKIIKKKSINTFNKLISSNSSIPVNLDKSYYNSILFFYKTNIIYISLRKSIKYFKLNRHSLLKKNINFLCNHGLKLTKIQSFFSAYCNLFLFFYSRDNNLKLKYTHHETFYYNIINYSWLRNIASLWIWVYLWLDFMFKYNLVKKKMKAGKKKQKAKLKLKYINPLKRTFVLNYYIKYLIKNQSYLQYKNRYLNVLLDIFLNYKNSRLYNLKIAIYKKNIEKIKQKS